MVTKLGGAGWRVELEMEDDLEAVAQLFLSTIHYILLYDTIYVYLVFEGF